jgi:hypothetical protein
VVGIVAAGGGIYFVALAFQPLQHGIGFLVHGGGVGVMMGSFLLFMASVFLMVGAPLLGIGLWALEPRRRWREWRNRARAQHGTTAPT